MNREHVLSVLYDIALTMGGEVRLDSLLIKVLQRLLFHTSFPVGVALLAGERPDRAVIAAVIGDHALVQQQGESVVIAPGWIDGACALIDGDAAAAGLPQWRSTRLYPHVLRLPVAPEGLLLLLSPEPLSACLPLTQVFRPVLRNLTKAIQLCRHSEQYTRSLISDRNQARHDLADALQRSETERLFLRQLTDSFPDLVWLKDQNGVYLACNPPLERLFGAPAAEIVGRTDAHFVSAELARFFRQTDLEAMTGSKPRVSEERLTFKADGGERLFEITKVPMHDVDGSVLGVLGIGRDITQRRRDEEQLHLAASVFTHAREGIVIARADGTILQVNDTFSEISGFAREEVVGRHMSMFQSDRHNPAYFDAAWHSLNECGYWDGEMWALRRNGESYPQLLTISAVRDSRQTAPQHLVALFSDISKIKEHERQLERIAHYDALTSLPNRVLFSDRLHQAMAQTHRRGDLLAVAYLDLDGFKEINDLHGHAVGDQFLAALATRMKCVLREGDTLARLGGDEFVAVLPELVSESDGTAVLARLMRMVADPVRIDQLLLQCTASIGVTFFPQSEAVDADQLLRQADQAMYQAKLSGKNRCHLFDRDLDRNVRGHHETIERARAALEVGEFVLFYQPKVNMRSGAVIGAEALIRWQHPTRGLLPPGLFLPVIEDHPLSIDLGEWVIDTALRQMEIWQAGGLDIQVSVNVGARQLQAPAFIERLRYLLARHPGVDPSWLELEILETSALQDVRQVGRVLEDCARLGVTCALDDFGTGYSSLSYLKRLPAQVLKIDQSFVRDMLDDSDDLAILEGVLGLAKAFQRTAVAEGVETVEHGVMLLELGCELAQGYGIARPMPGGSLPAWAASWRPDERWARADRVLPEDLPVLYAAVEHRAWIAQIGDCLAGRRTVPPQLNPDRCRFGEWLARRNSDTHRDDRPSLAVVDQLHRQIHVLADELLALHARGLVQIAQERLSELHVLRDQLLDELAGLRQSTGTAP